MKRPGVSKKQPLDAEHEPDLALISQMFPLPEEPRDPSIYLQFILDQGPNARMPIFSGGESAAHFQLPSQLTTNESATDLSRQHQQQLEASYQEATWNTNNDDRQNYQESRSSVEQSQSGNRAAMPQQQLLQALSDLPHIPSYIPEPNMSDDPNMHNFGPSAILPPNASGSDMDPGSAAYHAGFLAAQAMFVSQQDQIEQQLLNDPAVFSYQPSEASDTHE